MLVACALSVPVVVYLLVLPGGNGPNLMVKSIAQSGGVRMPGFPRYLAWSGAILLPPYAVVSLLFFG